VPEKSRGIRAPASGGPTDLGEGRDSLKNNRKKGNIHNLDTLRLEEEGKDPHG